MKKKTLEDQSGFVLMSPSWEKNNEVLYAMLHGEDPTEGYVAGLASTVARRHTLRRVRTRTSRTSVECRDIKHVEYDTHNT
jgi:hypothetical protein